MSDAFCVHLLTDYPSTLKPLYNQAKTKPCDLGLALKPTRFTAIYLYMH